MPDHNPFVIILCGLPATGKSTLGKHLSRHLNARHLDLEENILFPIFGLPDPNPYRSEKITEALRNEFRQSYDLLMHAAEAHLILEKSVILTAPFGNTRSQLHIEKLTTTHPTTPIWIIYCKTRRLEIEKAEIEQRLKNRTFGVDYFGCCNAIEHYLSDKPRFVDISMPHLELDTFPPHSVESCVQAILDYIKH